MKTRGESLLSLFLLVLLLPLGAAAQEQQQPPPADQGRRLVVTLDGKLEDMPTLTPDEFVIEMAKQKVAPKRVYKIEELPTLIAVVLQENLSLDFGAQLPALRDFILAQPPNTYVGVFYMAAQGVENPTNGFSSDLKKVADTLRTPKGKAELAPASPYESMAKVVKWMANLPAARKEVLFFSEGSDSVAGDAAPGQNRNLRVAIGETHAAGVPVWVIYTKGLRAPIRVAENMASVRAGDTGGAPTAPGPDTRSMNDASSGGTTGLGSGASNTAFEDSSYRPRVDYGTANLKELADKSGGKVLVSKDSPDIRPYLEQFRTLLSRQFVLEYDGEPPIKQVRMNRKLRDVKLLAPEK